MNEKEKAPSTEPRAETENSGFPTTYYNRFMNVGEVMAACGNISKSMAYKIIKGMNEELKKQGYITIAGKVPRKFFNEKMYC